MFKSTLLTLLFMAMTSAISSAHDRRAKFNIDEAIRTADMIFLGSVVDVNYASSQGDERALESLPHTFVTYQIERLIKGNPRQANDKITLRFLGGRGKEAQFLYPANFPLFDLKDSDIVFVKGNTLRSCPIFRCGEARMRVLQNLIFNERGQQVLLTPRQAVAFGKFEPRTEILTHQVSQTTIKAIPSRTESEGGLPIEKPIGKQFDLVTMMNYLEEKIKQVYTPEQMANLPIVKSANVQEPFTIKPLRMLSPKVMTAVPVRPGAQSEAERQEQLEYNNNRQNPVIRR